MAKKMRFVIVGEIVEKHDGMTVVKIANGFGDPHVQFASDTLVRAEPIK
jgi:hypothetical protein